MMINDTNLLYIITMVGPFLILFLIANLIGGVKAARKDGIKKSTKGSTVALITLFFISLALLMYLGAVKYKRGAERASCILNIRNMHQAVRAHQGISGLNTGGPLDWNNIFSTPTREKFLIEPTCPYDGSKYILSPTVPRTGKVAAECPHCDTLDHKPETTEGW